MVPSTRYRKEGDRTCIDLHVETVAQLFDHRDPAPFRDRDLDERAMDYLVEATEEIPPSERLRVVVAIDEPGGRLGAEDLRSSIRAHLTYTRGQVARRLRQERRRAELFFLIGSAILVLLLGLAELTPALPLGAARSIVREGLVITAWVAMWRPIESLLYDWWPHAARARQLNRLLDAEVTVVLGART